MCCRSHCAHNIRLSDCVIVERNHGLNHAYFNIFQCLRIWCEDLHASSNEIHIWDTCRIRWNLNDWCSSAVYSNCTYSHYQEFAKVWYLLLSRHIVYVSARSRKVSPQPPSCKYGVLCAVMWVFFLFSLLAAVCFEQIMWCVADVRCDGLCPELGK